MAAPKKEAVQNPQFVTEERFASLENSVSDLVDLIRSQAQAPQAPPPSPEEKEITKAGPNKYTVNPEWEEIAKEIVGPALDHTELDYLKGGGLRFTLVIKNEKSNAPLDYLERYKTDRRSREIGAEGESGVKKWCELVRNNLKKERPIT